MRDQSLYQPYEQVVFYVLPKEPEELPTFQETDTTDSGDGEPDAE